MEWFRKHTDAVIVLSAIVGNVLWMNSQFTELKLDMAQIDKDITVNKTVLFIED